MRKMIIFAALLFLSVSYPGFARADNEGHPLITAFKGSDIESQEVKEFDEQQLVIGKVQADGTVKTVKLEGKITSIAYRDPDNRSSLERIRNYEQALKKAGFEIVFNCAKEECGPEIQIDTLGYYPPERYLTASLNRDDGKVWVGVLVAAGPWTKIRIVEEKPMETDLVKFSAEQLQENIFKNGHMAVYGIYFDTGRSELQPKSAETIKEIASFLGQNPDLGIYLVGHTDNVGNLDDNLKLSEKRAAAVAKALTIDHKITASRLVSRGVGPLAPVATNETAEGRELNRRVEIVRK